MMKPIGEMGLGVSTAWAFIAGLTCFSFIGFPNLFHIMFAGFYFMVLWNITVLIVLLVKKKAYWQKNHNNEEDY